MTAGKKLPTITIEFEPVGLRVKAAAGSTLLDTAINSGIDLQAVCGGSGTCGSCKVKCLRGKLSEITGEEKNKLSSDDIKQGFRLACQAKLLSDVLIEIPPQSLGTFQRLQLEGKETPIDLHPTVIGRIMQICPPTLRDLKADDVRLLTALDEKGFPRPKISRNMMKSASLRLRDQNWQGKFVIDTNQKPAELISVLPVKRSILGFAADLGTTKIAMYLLNLETGETLAKCGAMNPQIAYGDDVVSRIAFCNQELQGGKILQEKIVQCLNANIRKMCSDNGMEPGDICAAVLVGNTAMHHLIAGLPVKQLGEAPYIPAVANSMVVTADEIGLEMSPSAKFYLPPNAAGFVGSDHLAVLLAEGLLKEKKNVVVMDIGTNTEISLVTAAGIYTCSCASGPAFEGAHIQFGMRAARGAIEKVNYEQGFHLKVIENTKPMGICGSGILDAVAEFRKTGIIDRRGTFDKTNQNVRKGENGFEFVLVDALHSGIKKDISINRKDINEIQLAKAAIQSGWEILVEMAGLPVEQIDHFIIAGAFGSYIDIESAIIIGMLPDLPRPKFQQVGNAAGMGAKQLLLSTRKRKEVEGVKSRIQYVELTTYPGFTDHFYKAMYL